MSHNANTPRVSLPTKGIDKLYTIVYYLITGFLSIAPPSCCLDLLVIVPGGVSVLKTRIYFFLVVHQLFLSIKSYSIKAVMMG